MLAISQGKTPIREDYPELPSNDRLWEVMEQCWDQDPERRPSIEELQSKVCEPHLLRPHANPLAISAHRRILNRDSNQIRISIR